MAAHKTSLTLLLAVMAAASAAPALDLQRNDAIVATKIEQNSTDYYPTEFLNLVTLGDKRYFFAKNQKGTWFEALGFCRAFGMDLVSIETKEENDLIKAHLVEIGSADFLSWTSGNKVGRATYMWINGANIIFEDWAAGQPAAPAIEHCLAIHKLHWHDLLCDYMPSASFICEER